MKRLLFVMLAVVSLISTQNKGFGQSGIIYTICGNDTGGFSGDNGPAIDAKINSPQGVCFDAYGNILLADAGNSRIRKISVTSSIITTIAGIADSGYNGDGRYATDAKLFFPYDVKTDDTGNIYIADAFNNRIRKIDASTGIITTIAGNGTAGYTGDNGIATNAEINKPWGLWIDNKKKMLYIAEFEGNVVRRVDLITDTINTIAGTGVYGYSGDYGPATNASFNGLAYICIDTIGNLIITDYGNNVIRMIDKVTDTITTIAGTGIMGYSGDNGPATMAELNGPNGLWVDTTNNDIFVAEFGSGTIRKIDGATHIITTIAGIGVPGYCCDGGPATVAKLQPDGVCVDKFGHIYVADYTYNRIRSINGTLGVPPSPALPSKLEKEVLVYPNPAKNELHIKGNSTYSEYKISNLMGQKLLSGGIKDNVIDIDNLPEGMYLIEMIDEEGNRKNLKFAKY